MDIINRLYGKSAMVLPHRPYTILTNEFRHSRKEDHSNWLGDPEEEWDPKKVFREARHVHFSDWPLSKVCSCHRLLRNRRFQELMGSVAMAES